MAKQDVNKLSDTCRYFVRLAFLVVKIPFLCCKSLVVSLYPAKLKDISNDIVLITGGSRGIGRQIALEIAKHKPEHIVLWGRGIANLERTAAEVRSLGIKCSYMSCDLGVKEQIYSKAQEIKDTIGPVSILVNNAGVVTGRKIVDSVEEEVEATFAVNTLAHIWTLKAFLPDMMDSQKGHIVTMSSVLSMITMAGLSDYCSSKFSTTGLCESLYWEVEEYPNIFMTSVHPYLVINDMFSALKLRFPRLIPALSEKYVAERTVQAVLTNTSYIIMPRIMYIIVLAQRIFPDSVLLPIYKFLGTDTAMDNFLSPKSSLPKVKSS
ncbi:Short-chain dehydrogenase/reductase 3 [Mizuhopecten yessoensis]|uniref:Short-chain dehydrogenase/reductase 3 n=2 Tax=Mizuhopecten yessoensis TaxID=6573 RepID=A0A210PXR1_MIZYE|nr:Short-chain dehydrogenase/reductase 3 [Mizuhopecten yessoensis]